MKRVLTFTATAFATALALAGCHQVNDDPPDPAPPATPAQVLAQLEQDGKLPKLDRSASVAGPDANANGVRDDIDAYLQQRFPSAQQHAAAVQMAKAVQSAVLADGSNPDASKAASQRIANAAKCVFTRFPMTEGTDTAAAVGQEIEAITANTKARLLAYLSYNKSRDGSSSSLPKGDTCE
jgi:hypothetical protein